MKRRPSCTEHGKARRNRQRDLDSFHQFARRYDATTVTSALTVVNIATTFKSPLRQALTVHKNAATLVQSTIGILRSIQLRASLDQAGLDANTVIIVDHDNVDSTKRHSSPASRFRRPATLCTTIPSSTGFATDILSAGLEMVGYLVGRWCLQPGRV